MTSPAPEMKLEEFSQLAQAIEAQVSQVIVGQQDVVRAAIICILAGRHALLEGVPGFGNTMLIKT
ncbi:MAG: AAA family ATPase, partial [Anaerolineae bacterium]